MEKDTTTREQANQTSAPEEINIDYMDRYWEAQMEIETLKQACKAQAEVIARLLK